MKSVHLQGKSSLIDKILSTLVVIFIFSSPSPSVTSLSSSIGNYLFHRESRHESDQQTNITDCESLSVVRPLRVVLALSLSMELRLH